MLSIESMQHFVLKTTLDRSISSAARACMHGACAFAIEAGFQLYGRNNRIRPKILWNVFLFLKQKKINNDKVNKWTIEANEKENLFISMRNFICDRLRNKEKKITEKSIHTHKTKQNINENPIHGLFVFFWFFDFCNLSWSSTELISNTY